ncbi:MAG: RnfABCDGE type electron transport complex subunit D [Bacilli bacterium]
MAFKTNSAPYQRAKKSTLQIMIELAIALAIVWIAAVVTTFIKLGSSYGVKSILLMLVSVGVTAVCDVLTTLFRNLKVLKGKELGKKIVYDLVHNYSWITAMILTLICPVWTSYYAIICGSIFATLVVKNFFGGFGSNIFNPAAFGRIFIQLCFSLAVPAGITSGVVSGATLTSFVNSSQQWLGALEIDGYGIQEILLGTYFGTMGEPFTLLLLVLGVVLAIRGDINWRAPVFYVGTTAIISILIALVLGFENPLLYVVYHLGLGGLMFGAVFMITDPVTTPTSPVGNCFVGIFAALMTVLLRIATNGAEGVVYSIALVNLITPAIDRICSGKTSAHKGAKYGVTFGTLAASILLCVGCSWALNGGREVNELNGISRKEYDELKSYVSFEFMDDNNYEFMKYEKELGNYDSLTTVGNCQKAYNVVDENNNVVAVVYCVKVDNIHIETEYASGNVTAIGYVAISTSTDQIIDITLTQVPNVSGYSSKVNNGVNDFDYTNKDILSEDPANIISGATYSAVGVKELAQKAFDVYQGEYKA